MPMQPRRLLYPLLDTVFHVMNSGCSSVLSRRLLAKENNEERDLTELVELAGVSVPDAGVDDVVDLVEGRLLDELAALASRFSNRDIGQINDC